MHHPNLEFVAGLAVTAATVARAASLVMVAQLAVQAVMARPQAGIQCGAHGPLHTPSQACT